MVQIAAKHERHCIHRLVICSSCLKEVEFGDKVLHRMNCQRNISKEKLIAKKISSFREGVVAAAEKERLHTRKKSKSRLETTNDDEDWEASPQDETVLSDEAASPLMKTVQRRSLDLSRKVSRHYDPYLNDTPIKKQVRSAPNLLSSRNVSFGT